MWLLARFEKPTLKCNCKRCCTTNKQKPLNAHLKKHLKDIAEKINQVKANNYVIGRRRNAMNKGAFVGINKKNT